MPEQSNLGRSPRDPKGLTTVIKALENSSIKPVPTLFRLPNNAHIGRVRLAISELELSIRFYTRVIGLSLIERQGTFARLGAPAGTLAAEPIVLLELEELPGVNSIAQGSRLGLYHTAFLLPTRVALGAFVRHLNALGVPFGAGDHLVSEAIYLSDPDGLQVEVYADRPRSGWPFQGDEIMMGTAPVRFKDLPAGEPWSGAPAGTTIGHVHLYVGDLKNAEDFYVSGLGLDVTTRRAPGASAGGYHHHVGLNVWAAGAPRATKEDARLLFWELVVPRPILNHTQPLHNPQIDAIAANLIGRGYREITSAHGQRAFADDCGIIVALVAE